MTDKVLVANLPPMTLADYARFEKEGGVWGKQRAVRRQQVGAMFNTCAFTTVAGSVWTKVVRRNTWLMTAGALPIFSIFGLVTGHAIGKTLYPSVAENKETTMMRLTWWAKECAKDWDLSQVDAAVWKAKYPNATLSK